MIKQRLAVPLVDWHVRVAVCQLRALWRWWLWPVFQAPTMTKDHAIVRPFVDIFE